MTESSEAGRDAELDRLLPWYVNGTLTGDELSAVEAYLAGSPAARREVAYLHSLRRGMQAVAMPQAPGELGLRRLLRDIDRGDAPAAAAGGEVVALGRRPRMSLWRPLAIAACLALLVESGVLLSSRLDGGGTVQLAGGPTVEAGPVIQVTFRPEAPEARIRELLLAVEATIVDGPSALGVYRLRLAAGPGDGDAVARAVAALEARPDLVEDVAEE